MISDWGLLLGTHSHSCLIKKSVSTDETETKKGEKFRARWRRPERGRVRVTETGRCRRLVRFGAGWARVVGSLALGYRVSAISSLRSRGREKRRA